jgi:FMN phosphatase YigB (HAD superfamily)
VIRAVLFDLDGTLYRQAPLRALMAAELATVPCLQPRPWRAARTWRILQTFREVREELRALGHASEPLERLQYKAAADRAGLPVDEMEAAVTEWIFKRPLKYLRHVLRPGTSALFDRLSSEQLRIGVFSDYPVDDKLAALGLAAPHVLTLEATAADVNAFKPHPRGFLRACELWNLRPDEVLYVGDRPEVDAAGAAAAGMPCVILDARPDGGYASVSTMEQIVDAMRRCGASERTGS